MRHHVQPKLSQLASEWGFADPGLNSLASLGNEEGEATLHGVVYCYGGQPSLWGALEGAMPDAGGAKALRWWWECESCLRADTQWRKKGSVRP